MRPPFARPDADAPLRVAHLMQYFITGGLERMVHGLATGARPVVESIALGYVEDGPTRAMLERDGTRTFLYPPRSGRRWGLPLWIGRMLRRERIELLHTHHLGPFMYGAPVARALGIPVVHTEHSLEFYDAPRRRRVGRLMPRLATVTCVGPSLSAWREEHFGDRPVSIRNGIAVPATVGAEPRAAARALLGLPADAFVVGTVARLGPEKDLPTLVRAFARLNDAQSHLVIVGKGPEADRIAAAVKDADLGDRAHLLGERLDVADLLPALDVFGLTSQREGLPLAVLEAMANAVPFVATAVGELPALAEHGAGVVAPVGDVEGLAALLRSYRHAPTARAAAGQAARALVQAEYSQTAMVERYLDIYRQVTGRPLRR